MGKKKQSSGSDDWNPSHATRFSSGRQPQRRRGQGKVKGEGSVLRTLVEGLREPARVTSNTGDTLKMSNVDYIVKSAIKQAMTGSLDDKIKFMDKLDKWDVLGQLEADQQALDDLNRQLDEAKEEIKALRRNHELAANMAAFNLDQALTLLTAIGAFLGRRDAAGPIEVLAVRRQILQLILELADTPPDRKGSRSLGWNSGESEEQWVTRLFEEEAEKDRVRNERLAQFDRENSTGNDDGRSDPDDDFFPDLTSEN